MANPPGTSKVELYPHQKRAINQLKTGSILYGGVGSGKSLTAIAYYYKNEYPKDLYIITTARKRDTLDWIEEAKVYGVKPIKVDSWNNIKKYINIKDSFFIFDEQRLIGSGVWVKSFLKIVKLNEWILLSATPGDTWMDYIPVFVANGFYRNRTQFIKRHVIFNRFLNFPKVERYIDTHRLEKMKEYVLVPMEYEKKIKAFYEDISVGYDKEKLEIITKKRWNPFKDKPIKNMAELVFNSRKVVNSSIDRLTQTLVLLEKHRRLVIFYNFNYELDILRTLPDYDSDIKVSEYNGHKHEPIPDSEKWAYLVQYISGSEAWNCIETNVILFYSLNYSYRMMIQAAGRIDRMNTPFSKLYYYRFISDSLIDKAIKKSIKNKKKFNEIKFARKTYAIIEGE
jgi:hypothetical protein